MSVDYVQSKRRWGQIQPCAASATAAEPLASTPTPDADQPLLLRALTGREVERPPVWMMRQAGRYMKAYMDLCKKHPSFRERSENADLAVEVSLQPWKAFKPDGVILFSDILTPLSGMNIPFDITGGAGPLIHNPIRTMEQVREVSTLVPQEATPYVGEALTRLREEVGNQATVLGFVGAPFTLASYIVEGESSKMYTNIKTLMFKEPAVLHALLEKLADNIAEYVRYQTAEACIKETERIYHQMLPCTNTALLDHFQHPIDIDFKWTLQQIFPTDKGAQVVQIFDSWASELQPQDFDIFAGPYIKKIIDSVRETHPSLAIILYISGSGGLLERMAACKPDIVSVDQRVDLADAIKRIGPSFAVQGNMDPGVLFGSKDAIQQRIIDTVKKAQGTRHIMNLGHGVLVGTPEDNVAHFFEVSKGINQYL